MRYDSTFTRFPFPFPTQNLYVIHSQHLGGVENVQDIEDRMWKHVRSGPRKKLYCANVSWEGGDHPSFRQMEAVSQKLLEVLGVEGCPAYVVRDPYGRNTRFSVSALAGQFEMRRDPYGRNGPSIVLVAKVGLGFRKTQAELRVASALQQLDREFGWGEFRGKSRDADVKKDDGPGIQRDEEVYAAEASWLKEQDERGMDFER